MRFKGEFLLRASKRILTGDFGGDCSRLDVLSTVDQHDQERQEQDYGLQAKKHLEALFKPTWR